MADQMAVGSDVTVPHKRILIVEDDESVRSTLVSMLEDGGYDVSFVDGGAAMRIFMEGEVLVDLVVLDALMPGEKSASLAFFIGELGLPLIMISGSPSEIERAHKKRLQMLEKPFGQAALLEAVEAAFRFGAKSGQRSSD
jgi:DNA-binding response OmpR family regulator